LRKNSTYRILYDSEAKVYSSNHLILKAKIVWHIFSYDKLFFFEDKLVLKINYFQGIIFYTKIKIVFQDLPKLVYLNSRNNICYDGKEILVIESFKKNQNLYRILIDNQEVAHIPKSAKLIYPDIELQYIRNYNDESEDHILIELIAFIYKLNLLQS
jgi:hypothetical protein